MLSYDSLIEQAISRGMPPTKIRGILREYLQILILKEIYRTESGKELYFTGGTYLRLVHGSKRFSEDLDFNAEKIEKKEFEDLLKKNQRELEKTGLQAVLKFAHWENVYVAKLTFPDVEKEYQAISKFSKKEGIAIKVETYNPKWKVKIQTQVISGFGEFYPCVCTDKGYLFADKIDAFTKKTRGRHLYDLVFMLSNKYPIDKETLTLLGIKKDPLEVILERTHDLSKAELKKQAEVLRPFLFDESQADLLVNAHQIIPHLIEQYRSSLKK